MSISHGMELSEPASRTYDPHRPASPPNAVWVFNCRQCGFAPENAILAPRLCPKCGSSCFERVPVPRALLDAAERTGPLDPA